mgnify:CR=1 FL=1
MLSGHPYRSILTCITLDLYEKEHFDIEFLKMP